MSDDGAAGLPLLRQSERAAFKRCNWSWYQSYVKGLAPLVERKDAADFGTFFHVALAEYYQPGLVRGPHPAETWDTLTSDYITKIKVEANDEEQVSKWVDFHALGLSLAEAYVDRYQGDPHWDVLDAERRFMVQIPDVRVEPIKDENGRRGYMPIVNLVGTFDLCVRDLNQETEHGPVIKMVDHKTTNFIQTHHLTLDEQASTYIAVATHALRDQGLIGPKDVVKGMEYNFIKRAELDTRPRDENGLARNKPQKQHYIDVCENVPGFNPKWKLEDMAKFVEANNIGPVYGEVSANQNGDNFMRHFVPRTPKERQRQIVRISEEARVMDDVRHGRLPLLKTPQRDCNFCKFFELCELDESGGDTEYFISTTMKQSDPYSDHRDGAENSKKVGG